MNSPNADEARQAVHEALAVLPAPEADRLRTLIADLERAVRDEAQPVLCDHEGHAIPHSPDCAEASPGFPTSHPINGFI